MPSNLGDNRKHLEAFAKAKGPMMEAAQDILNLLSAASFASPDFIIQMFAYFSVEPPVIEAAAENLAAFCKRTLSSENQDNQYAKTVIKCFVDRIVAEGFQIDFNTLTSIGITLGNNDYDEQGARCLKRAGAKISQQRKGN